MRPDSSLAIDSDGKYYVVEKTTDGIVTSTMNKRRVADETNEKKRNEPNRIDFTNMPPPPVESTGH